MNASAAIALTMYRWNTTDSSTGSIAGTARATPIRTPGTTSRPTSSIEPRRSNVRHAPARRSEFPVMVVPLRWKLLPEESAQMEPRLSGRR